MVLQGLCSIVQVRPQGMDQLPSTVLDVLGLPEQIHGPSWGGSLLGSPTSDHGSMVFQSVGPGLGWMF